jgi:hypothetical protein
VKISTVEVTVRTTVDVFVADGVFTPQFMQEFRESFSPFTTEEEHVERIARMYARRLWDNQGFFEGYGYLKIHGSYLVDLKKIDPSLVMDIDIYESDEDEEVEIQ